MEPPHSALLTLPPWLWGGNPEALVAECAYRVRQRSPQSGEYQLQANESYFRQRPDLVRVRTLASHDGTQRYQELAKSIEHITPPKPERLASILEARRAKAERDGGLIDLILHQQLLIYALPVEKLPIQVRYFHESLRDIRFQEDQTIGPFRNSSVHLIEVDPALLHRLKIASVWLRIEQDLRVKQGDLSAISATLPGDSAFNSSADLYSGVYLFDAYLGPLLAAATPGVWAITVTRTFGTLVIGLGSLISGTTDEASEFLHLISIPGASEAVKFPVLSPDSSTSAVIWWTNALNAMFGVLSDLAVFTNREGWYSPAKHLEALLTVEQVFRRTTSMLVAHRDVHGRRALFFTLLDSLESISGIDFIKMCRLPYAQATLSRLRGRMPKDSAEILLLTAERGVAALEKMQDGFFIRRQAGTDEVELQLGSGGMKKVSPEEGVARYLKVLRDATHGHGSNKPANKALTDALLAHHNGEVPHELGLIAYLYLMDILSSPERLRRVLYRAGR